MPGDAARLTRRVSGVRGLLGLLVALQVVLGLYRVALFDLELARIPSRLGLARQPHAGSSVPWLLLLLAASALWASLDREGSDPFSARFGAWGLAHLALLGLVPYALGLAGAPLWRPAGQIATLLSAALAAVLALRARGKGGPAADERGLTLWDAATAAILAGLLVPTLFPYVHFDAKQIWACRALAFQDTASLAGVGSCFQKSYPPVFSLLLWSGLDDPLFQGRLAPWLVLALFLLFLRGRLVPVLGRNAAAGAAFVAATGHVAINAGMFYANAALMAFLCAGLFLTLGLPAGEPRAGWRLRFLAGPLCLAAAALVRPDGLVYAAVVGAAVLWERLRGGLRLPLWPFGVALGAGLTWILRPAAFRFGANPFTTRTEEWRTAGATPSAAAWEVLKVYLNSAQGQMLAHWGLGVAVPLLLGLAVWRLVRPGLGTPVSGFALHVSLLSLAAVLAIYLVVPFVGDPVAAVQPFEETGFLACYRNFVRVGMGRMTIHLLPFWLLIPGLGSSRARPGH